MRKQHRKTDHLSLLIMTAFLVLGTWHFMCRFDIGNYIEGMFNKAWAQQTSISPARPAAAVLPIEDALALPAVQTGIARNPFMAPAAALVKKSADLRSARPGAYAEQPLLRGIVNNGIKKLAIIEYAQSSNYYKNGQKFGDYTVTAIDTASVDLSHPQRPLHLTLGRND